MLKKACRRSTRPTINFHQPNVELILQLNRSEAQAIEHCKSILGKLSQADKTVISHEFLENNHIAVHNICRAAEQTGIQSILIIGYTRRQDQWIRSSFNQWNFRNKQQLNRGVQTLKQEHWHWTLFSSYERWLITGLINHEGPDWNTCFQDLQDTCHSIQRPCTVTSSPLPKSDSPKKLLIHFNECCKLGLDRAFLNTCNPKKNKSFSEYITETISESILLNSDGNFPITPHSHNRLLRRVSEDLPHQIPAINADFIAALEGHYLSIFQASNQAYCTRFEANFEEHFSPKGVIFTGLKQDITSLIDAENHRRHQHAKAILESKAAVRATATRAMLQALCT